MDTEAALLCAVRDEPDSDEPRLVLADWYEEHGQIERAELIRVQCRLAVLDKDDDEVAVFRARADAILEQHEQRFLSDLAPLFERESPDTVAGDFTFHRGFVEAVDFPLQGFARHMPTLFDRLPLCRLRLKRDVSYELAMFSQPQAESQRWYASWTAAPHSTGPDLAALAAIVAFPDMARIVVLDLGGVILRGEGMAVLASSRNLTGLRDLSLAGTAIGDADLAVLASAPLLRGLARLRFGEGIGEAGITALADSRMLGRLRALHLWNSQGFDAGAAEAMADAPSFAGLEELTLNLTALGDPGIAALARSEHLRSLRQLHVDNCGIGSAGAATLAASPNVASLEVLHLSHNAIGPAGACALAASPRLDRLQELRLFAGEVGPDGAEAFATAPGLARLRVLDLACNRIGTAGAVALARSPYLRGLRELHLATNFIGEEGTRAMLASPLVAGCRHLDLSYNELNPAAVALLARSPDLARLRFLGLCGCGGPTGGDEAAHSLIDSPNLGGLEVLNLQDAAFAPETVAALRARFGDRVWLTERE